MSTHGQFSKKNPTIRRILKEASELASSPSTDYHAEPLEDNLFEWHFTLQGPPEPSPYAGGIYHGRIVLPLTYPLRPPSFRFLTPSGRFEVNREICLSISGHHEETWQPAWGIRTALVAIRSFMDTDVKGQVGGLVTPDYVRKDMAKKSADFVCTACKKSNKKIIEEKVEAVKAMGEDALNERKEETVPEELRLAYREELRGDAAAVTNAMKESRAQADARINAERDVVPTPTTATSQVVPQTLTAQQQQHRRQEGRRNPDDAWIDSLIYTFGAILSVLILKKILVWLFP